VIAGHSFRKSPKTGAEESCVTVTMLQSNSRSNSPKETKPLRSPCDIRKLSHFKSSSRGCSKHSLGHQSFLEGKVYSPAARFLNSPQLVEVSGAQKLSHPPSAQAAFPRGGVHHESLQCSSAEGRE